MLVACCFLLVAYTRDINKQTNPSSALTNSQNQTTPGLRNPLLHQTEKHTLTQTDIHTDIHTHTHRHTDRGIIRLDTIDTRHVYKYTIHT